jgi:poly(A) polymerase
LDAVLPQAAGTDVLVTLVGIDDRDPVRRLAALIGANGAAVGPALKLSKAEQERLAALAPPVKALSPDLPVSGQRQLLYELGAERVVDLVLLAWAGDRRVRADAWRAMLENARNWEAPALPVRGSDALALGVPAGPEVGELVAGVERWWREGDFSADRESCLTEMRRLAGL